MANQISPTTGEEISKADAVKWITTYQSKNPGAIYAQFFGADHLNKILGQADCVGIRIYQGIGDEGTTQLILVGARADSSNIWPAGTDATVGDGGGVIVDKGAGCPPNCPPDL